MSKLLTCFFFFQCLSLGFSQQAESIRKIIPEPILIPNYYEMTFFQGDYALVYDAQTRKVCLLNKQGKEVTCHPSVEFPKNGLLKTEANYREESSIIDLLGNVIVPLGKYDCIIFDDYIMVSDVKNNICKVLDLKGRQIFTSNKFLIPVRKNYFLASKDSTHQIINEKGKVLAQTVIKELKMLNSRFFAFKKGDVWGIMNDKFKEVVSPKYGSILSLPNSWIGLQTDAKYGVLDSNLREAIPFGAYDEIGFTDKYGGSLIGDGLISVRKKDSWGYVNIKNQLVINFWFKNPSAFYNGYALQNKGSILIDKKGRIVKNFPYTLKFESILSSNLILAEIDNTRCYIDYESNVILKCKPKNVNELSKYTPSEPPPPPPEEPTEPVSPQPKSEEIFSIVEQRAEYIGGEEALSKFLSSNLKYPQEAQKAGISGVVFIKFKVKSDGTLENPTIIKDKGLGYGCDEEAVRLIKAMPKWKPAKNQDRPVDSSYGLAISFNL